MSSSEEVAYPILRKHDVDYVLIIFGGLIGYSGDDINKFLWMVRIAQGIWPDEIQESNYFTSTGEYRVDERASKAMKESLMYKMSYYRYVLLWLGSELFWMNLASLVLQISSEGVNPSTESVNRIYLKQDPLWIMLVSIQWSRVLSVTKF